MTTAIQSHSAKLSVFQYADYRAFLKDYYEMKKLEEPSFSHAVFAERAGFESRSYLRLVITNKRNISSDGIEKFCKGLGLSEQDSQGFHFLVMANQALTLEERKRYWDLFLSVKPKTTKTQRVHDEFTYLSRKEYPLLLAVLRQRDVNHDVESLSTVLGVSIEKVEEGIHILQHMGAIRRNDKGEWTATDMILETSDDVPSVAIQSFHKNILDKAKESLLLSPELREFQSVILSLNEEGFQHIKARLRDLAQEVDQLFGSQKEGATKVFAMNLNLVPVSHSFIRRPHAASQKAMETLSHEENPS